MTAPASRNRDTSGVLDRLPFMGIGISTDLYFPPLEPMLEALFPEFLPDYIEIFRGRTCDLERARTETVPRTIPMTYHGDALWYTQPDFPDNPSYQEEIRRANRHLDTLEAPWMIHECAQKALLGRTFGVYLPPVLSDRSAEWTRYNALSLASRLEGRTLLVEIPPFPLFSVGDLGVGAFFRAVVGGTDLGLGLDIGHALTAYRLLNPSPSPEGLASWLDREFPLEQVVEIHVGGMETIPNPYGVWFWDDHSREIPQILWDSLDAVLRYCTLPVLKGVALEVDNKEIPLVAKEFRTFRRIVERRWTRSPSPIPLLSLSDLGSKPSEPGDRNALEQEYADYLETIFSAHPPETTKTLGMPGFFRDRFLPEDVWSFGGHIPDLFPKSLSRIERFVRRPKDAFVSFFHGIPLTDLVPYDYLRTKVTVFGLWVEALIRNCQIPPDTIEEIRRLAHHEGRQILDDQERINGDPLGDRNREGYLLHA